MEGEKISKSNDISQGFQDHRIIQWFGLEGTFKGQIVQPPIDLASNAWIFGVSCLLHIGFKPKRSSLAQAAGKDGGSALQCSDLHLYSDG